VIKLRETCIRKETPRRKPRRKEEKKEKSAKPTDIENTMGHFVCLLCDMHPSMHVYLSLVLFLLLDEPMEVGYPGHDVPLTLLFFDDAPRNWD